MPTIIKQAQFLAEKHGLNKLAMKISNEHDDLLKQQILWDNLKETKSSFAERMNLVKLSEQMDNMLHKHAIETPNLISEEPILLLINAHGGITAFSKIFTETLDIESDLIGGYLTAINQFGEEIFSGRA